MLTLLLGISSASAVLAGWHFASKANRQPEMFTTYLAAGLIISSPLYIAGYTWYDELFAFSYLMGSTSRASRRTLSVTDILFIVFCVYLVVQGVRGILFFTEIEGLYAALKARWLLLFLIVFAAFAKSRAVASTHAQSRDFAYNVTLAGLAFNVVYLVFGLLSTQLTGTTAYTQYAMISAEYREDTSPLLAMFGATAYVACIYAVIVPAAIVTLVSDSDSRARVAWVMLATSLATQLLYNSRSGMLIIVGFLTMVLLLGITRRYVVKGMILFAPLVAIALLLQVVANEHSLANVLDDLGETVGLGERAAANPGAKDIDRQIWNATAFEALTETPYHFFTGWGLRTSGYIVAPFVFDRFQEVGRPGQWIEDIGTTGLAAFAVDTGVVGLTLLGSLVLLCALSTRRAWRTTHFTLAAAPVVIFLQLAVANIFDVTLFYVALMPFGIYGALATSAVARQSGLSDVAAVQPQRAMPHRRLRRLVPSICQNAPAVRDASRHAGMAR